MVSRTSIQVAGQQLAGEIKNPTSLQVNEQLSPVWSTFLTISVTLSIITLNWKAPVKNDWLLKWAKNKI